MRLFISYSRHDEAAVRSLREDLKEAHDVQVWLDEELGVGESWWATILEQIRLCTVFIFALSDMSLRSEPCRAELGYAEDLGLPILPVQVGEVTSYRTYPIFNRQLIDYRESSRTFKLVWALHEHAAKRTDLPDPLPPAPPIPYEYLQRNAEKIRVRGELPSSAQLEIVFDLSSALDEEDEQSVRDNIRELLGTLRKRRDVSLAVADQIDTILKRHPADDQPGGKQQSRTATTTVVDDDITPRPEVARVEPEEVDHGAGGAVQGGPPSVQDGGADGPGGPPAGRGHQIGYAAAPAKPEWARQRKVATIAVVAAVILTGVAILGYFVFGGTSRPSGTAAQPSSPTGSSASQIACGGKRTLKASGSTAQANAMTKFVNLFEQACSGQTLNYTANGSGAGVSEFIGNQTDFGGSDSPLNSAAGQVAQAAQRCGSPAWNLPAVFGAIAVTYNIAGVSSLALDAPTMARIFNGGITTWDDPAIKQLNPSVNLPATRIHVVFRSDQSGTTDNFQQYLDAASFGAWGKGAGKTFTGGVGEGAKGNDGTSAAIKNTDGSITYNEWSFAQAQKLNMANIITSAGPDAVQISTDTVGSTIAGATVAGQGNDLVLDNTSFYKPTRPGSYPLVLVTYEIVCSKYPDSQTGTAVKAFLQTAIGPGQNGLADNGYVPVPDAFLPRLSTAVNAIA